MCGALGSAWGTPGNLGNTVGASCQTIGNFMEDFKGQGEPARTKWAPSPAWVRPFSGHIKPQKCEKLTLVCARWAISLGAWRLCVWNWSSPFLLYPILVWGRVPISHLKNLLCKTRDKVWGEFFHFQTTWIFSICQKYVLKKKYISKYSFL
jgi:hypothetical protein